MNYLEYLHTDHWKKKRLEALDYYHYECCTCGYKKNLEVHHKRYIHLFNELIEDLTVLCPNCYIKYHFQEMEVAELDDISVLIEKENQIEDQKYIKWRTAKLEDDFVQEYLQKLDESIAQSKAFRKKNYG